MFTRINVFAFVILVSLSKVIANGGCNADNCLRALSQAPDTNSAFCSSYTATTGFGPTPTEVAFQCSSSSSRISSACTCFVTSTTSLSLTSTTTTPATTFSNTTSSMSTSSPPTLSTSTFSNTTSSTSTSSTPASSLSTSSSSASSTSTSSTSTSSTSASSPSTSSPSTSSPSTSSTSTSSTSTSSTSTSSTVISSTSTSTTTTSSSTTSTTPTSTPCAKNVCFSVGFNSQSVPSGDIVWLSAVFKPKFSGTLSTVSFTNTRVIINSVQSSTTPPDSFIQLDSSLQSCSTAQLIGGVWQTTAPLPGSGNTFLSAVSIPVPPGTDYANAQVSWCGDITAPGEVDVQIAAAVYTSCSENIANPEACETHTNYHAGVPTGCLNNLVPGGTGGGGSNYSGSLSATYAVCKTN